MTPPDPTGHEALLAQSAWMRALAMALVRDPHEADDVVQDATLAALVHPPPSGSAARAWLAAVVRNFAWRRRRADARRREHEARAQDAAVEAGATETLERIDLQRELLEAVRALEEPLRTTVVQRYFEGRSCAEIARALSVPAGTVRARLKRGLDRLRERLDRDLGSRGAWIALIAPFVPREATAGAVTAGRVPVLEGAVTAHSTLQGALIMSLVKIAVPLALTALAGLALWNAVRHRSAEPVAALTEPAAAGILDAPDIEVPEAGLEPHRAVAEIPPARAAAAEIAQAPAPDPATVGSLEARFVDEAGLPWPGVEFEAFEGKDTARAGSEREVIEQTVSGSDGRATLDLSLPSFLREDGLPLEWRFELRASRPGCATRRLSAVIHAGTVAQLGDVRLSPGASVGGRVVTALGVAVPDALVGALAEAEIDTSSPERLAAIARIGDAAFDPLLATQSGADGGFELAGVAPGRVRLWADAPDLRYGIGNAFELLPGAHAENIEIRLPEHEATDKVVGRVVGPDGKGRVASVSRTIRKGERIAGVRFFQTDLEGRFEFPVEDMDAVYDLRATDGYGEYADSEVNGVRPGDPNVLIAFAKGPSLLVRARAPGGEPVLEARIAFSTPAEIRDAATQVRSPGDYLVQVPAGTFHLVIEAPGFRKTQRGPYSQDAAPVEMEVVLERAPIVRGRVTAGGAPVADANVSLRAHDPAARITTNGLRCVISPFESGTARTDSQGRFEVAADLDGPFVVRAEHPDWVDGEVGPLSAGDLEGEVAVELSRGGAIEGFVRVAAGASPGGRVVVVHRGDGRARSVRAAADGSYRFEGLMAGPWQVLGRDDDIDPHSTHFASYSGDEPWISNCTVVVGRTTRYDLDQESK